MERSERGVHAVEHPGARVIVEIGQEFSRNAQRSAEQAIQSENSVHRVYSDIHASISNMEVEMARILDEIREDQEAAAGRVQRVEDAFKLLRYQNQQFELSNDYWLPTHHSHQNQ